jgi:CheY-like chemotaxis protein
MQNEIHLSEGVERFIKGSAHDSFNKKNAQEAVENKIRTDSDAVLSNDGGLALPAQVIATPAEVAPVVQQKRVYDFAGKTVLVVDDVSFNLTLMELFFRNTGAVLLFASNGREAVDMYMSHPEVDIILMDIQMPVMNGLEATHEIQILKPGLPVIAITAFVHSDDRQRCFEAGCVDFLPKPCSRDNLLKTVNSFF